MYPAIFLDRDGVIIKNQERYVRSWKDVEFLPHSLQALEQLSQTKYKIIIISNQSAIGRGFLSSEKAGHINQRVVETISTVGGRIDGLYICPHTANDHCDCRKPLPGLIFRAASNLSIDLPSSVLIGDALSDIQAGFAAGIQTLILVKTGLGNSQLHSPQIDKYPNLVITDDLQSATKIIHSKSIP
jgi:D-glycero-D-manno-heptose 1,7-bisphosphate phosphatase